MIACPSTPLLRGLRLASLLVILHAVPLVSARAATYYVSTVGNDAAAGTNWATAKQTIQAAVNLAINGDTVLVTNGTYITGTTVTPGFTTSNRVVITNNILVTSVNGASVTTIQGFDNGINSPLSVRCVYMSAGTLVGFRLTQGRAPLVSTNDAQQNLWGGGAYAPGGTIEDCIINANDSFQGGGVYGGTLRNCFLYGNYAVSGGGAQDSSLYNCVISNNSQSGADNCYLQGCTVVNNSASFFGGGLFGGMADQCRIIGNTAPIGGGAVGATLNNCLVVSNSADLASGAAGGTLNNCTVAYNHAALEGGVWQSEVYNSIVYFNSSGSNVFPNHYESTLSYSCSTPMPTGGVGNITSNPLFLSAGDYRLMTNSPCVNAGNNAYVVGTTDIDGNPRIENGTVDMGAYEISRTHYVAPGGASIFPYTRWADAATNIQDAVDAAPVGNRVVVSNGVYETGTRVTPGFHTSNRLVVTKNVQVISANGPSVTTIKGLNAGNSLTSVRCLYMSSGSLSGFTLTGGYAQGLPPTHPENRDGGGAYMTGGSLSNCWIVGNSATSGYGGGVRGGVLYDCQILNNRAESGGGAYVSTLVDSILSGNNAHIDGGGTYFSDLLRCQITGNMASNIAGGAYGGMIGNCLFSGNVAVGAVGGAFIAELSNCTVIANSASNAGGVAYCETQNSIVYDNMDLTGNPNFLDGTFAYSCTWPNPGAGAGNITNNPIFEGAGSALLASNSPCINAGNNAYAAGTLDLARRMRIVDGVVDMGAYEFNIYPVHYVAPGGASIPPYSSWANAATNIQDAIDIAQPGELVLVSNGVYNSGTRLTPGYASSNRIVLAKDITVRSVNGPLVTVIEGFNNGNNYGSVRCAYISGGILSGFMLTNGATPGVIGIQHQENDGAGAYLESGVLENCIVTGNEARGSGGGVRGGTVNGCIIRNNVADEGGGAASATLNNCAILRNTAGVGGGGATAHCTLNNCSVVDNTAYFAMTAGTYGGTVRNSIVYHNTLILPAVGGSSNRFGATFYFSCVAPLPPGGQNVISNIAVNPLFVNVGAGNLRLQSSSPCINKGANMYVVGSVDAEGSVRINDGIVDMGAYEYFLSGYWAWAADIVNSLTNFTDTATGDGYPNLLKYATGSSATTPDDVAKLTIAFTNDTSALLLNRNTNATDVTLFVETTTNLVAASWSGIATNIAGNWGASPNVAETGAGSPKSVMIEHADAPNRAYRLRVTRP